MINNENAVLALEENFKPILIILELDEELSNEKIEDYLDLNGFQKIKRVILNKEISMFKEFINIVESIDPDIIIGYDTQRLSIGYIIKR